MENLLGAFFVAFFSCFLYSVYMELYIDTTEKTVVKIALKAGDSVFEKSFSVDFDHAEKLLPEISRLLKHSGFKPSDIKSIRVNNAGGTFTSLRIGVVTANALAFALGVPIFCTDGKAKKVAGIEIVTPAYDGEPNITKKSASVDKVFKK